MTQQERYNTVIQKIESHVKAANECNMTQFSKAKTELSCAIAGFIALNKSLVQKVGELESKIEKMGVNHAK